MTNSAQFTPTATGTLISFEGGEGAGKTVQIKRLRDRLYECGHEVVVLREPGGTTISEQIREVVLSAKNIGIAYTTEVLLFQAARAQLYREIVLPSLQSGKIVLMDRTRDSSVVYQGMVRGFGVDMIEQLNNISTENTYPNLTFLLDVSPEVGISRRQTAANNGVESMDRIDLETLDFHQKVRQAYLEWAGKDERGRWVTVDGAQEIEAIANQIWEEVRARDICL